MISKSYFCLLGRGSYRKFFACADVGGSRFLLPPCPFLGGGGAYRHRLAARVKTKAGGDLSRSGCFFRGVIMSQAFEVGGCQCYAGVGDVLGRYFYLEVYLCRVLTAPVGRRARPAAALPLLLAALCSCRMPLQIHMPLSWTPTQNNAYRECAYKNAHYHNVTPRRKL